MNWLTGIPLIGDVFKVIFGSRLERDRFDAQAKASSHSQFAAEFGNGRNWFDSLIDGLNRLPRPIFAFGTIYLFVLCWVDPKKFVDGAENLELMPQEAWWILGTIVVFFFGGRLHRDFGKYKIPNKVLQKYQEPSAPLKTESKEPQSGIEWNDRKEVRYKRKDWDNLNQ